MVFLNPKKLRKLQSNPQAFFKDALDKRIIPIQNQLKAFKPKKKHAFAEYYIISAVYNAEKYLEDYFHSILNQRLDFKNNIHIICVDDGSTDNSAEIIKKYQAKYPKHITYLHKENGGQASARNLGLKWLKEHLGSDLESQISNDTASHTDSTMQSILKAESKPNAKPLWVTFTDPDDFLDRDYFYEVDRFLEDNQEIKLAISRIKIYKEKFRIFTPHFTDFQFLKRINFINAKEINDVISNFARCCFSYEIIKKHNLLFDENLKSYFESTKFFIDYFSKILHFKVMFLGKSIYYIRKSDISTTQKAKNRDVHYYLHLKNISDIFKQYPKDNTNFSCLIQNLVLSHLYFNLRHFVNHEEKLYFMNEEQKKQYLEFLDNVFSYIDTKTIESFFDNIYNSFFYKVALLACFKNSSPSVRVVNIKRFDAIKQEILIDCVTSNIQETEIIKFDSKEVATKYEKIMQYDFLNRVFCYRKRIWVSLPRGAKKLEVFIENNQAQINYKKEKYLVFDCDVIRDEIQTILKEKSKGNLWLFIDRDTEADDNAEHLYRYIMKNYPHQNIAFALRKTSHDWKRLESEGFRLIDFDSFSYDKTLWKCSKIISSQANPYIVNRITKQKLANKDYVFLQHGVTKDDSFAWMNPKPFSLFITATRQEYQSIAQDYNHYKFTPKEVKLTGFSRHDALLKNNRTDSKKILIMPTWRKALNGEKNLDSCISQKIPDFKQSSYYQAWNSLFGSEHLKEITEKYQYEIWVNLHPQMLIYKDDFQYSKSIKFVDSSLSIQNAFCQSALMITDYSSVAFEMAYLKKPVLYYQFDEQEFLLNHSYTKGYFDYRRDGFGPIVTTEEDLLKELEILLKDNCKVGEPYKSNIENTFEFRDGKCCERIYQEILKLDKPYIEKD